MPSVRLYWANESWFAPVADLMSRNRFQQLLKYLHFADNPKMKPPGDPCYDRLYKIQPLFQQLKLALYSIPHKEELSVDEQKIPFKGCSAIKKLYKEQTT